MGAGCSANQGSNNNSVVDVNDNTSSSSVAPASISPSSATAAASGSSSSSKNSVKLHDSEHHREDEEESKQQEEEVNYRQDYQNLTNVANECDCASIIPGRNIFSVDLTEFDRCRDECLKQTKCQDNEDAKKVWAKLREPFVGFPTYEHPPLGGDGFVEWTQEQTRGVLPAGGSTPNLLHLSPKKIAKQCEVPQEVAIEQLLTAVALGHLIMTFHRRCEACENSLSVSPQIGNLNTEPIQCSACRRKDNKENAHSLNNVAVLFDYAPRISYCPMLSTGACGKPAPEFMSNVRGIYMIGPTPYSTGKHRIKDMTLEPGNYTAVCTLSLAYFHLIVIDPASASADLLASASDVMKVKHSTVVKKSGFTEFTLKPEFTLEVDCDMKSMNTFIFFKVKPEELAAVFATIKDPVKNRDETTTTLSDMLFNSTFSKLFPNQTVSLDQQYAVSGCTILFTDIADSTRMYANVGDSKAINAVIQHFGVVFKAVSLACARCIKTVGDAVMCCTTSPLCGIAIAVASIIGLHSLNRKLEKNRQIHLKCGIHSGLVNALPLNGTNDILGQEVNVSARIQGTAASDEIVVSTSVASLEEILAAPEKNPMKYAGLKFLKFVRTEDLSLKGVDGLVRVNRFSVKAEDIDFQDPIAQFIVQKLSSK